MDMWRTYSSDEVVLRQRSCRRCHAVFWICPHCDRGQRYCSAFCRVPARRQQRRCANRRHQQSPEGRLDHRDRQREYRHRRRRIRGPRDGSRFLFDHFAAQYSLWDARSARTAASRVSVAAFAFTQALPVWRKESDEQRPPFLCCVVVRPGWPFRRSVSQNPTILGYRDDQPETRVQIRLRFLRRTLEDRHDCP